MESSPCVSYVCGALPNVCFIYDLMLVSYTTAGRGEEGREGKEVQNVKFYIK